MAFDLTKSLATTHIVQIAFLLDQPISHQVSCNDIRRKVAELFTDIFKQLLSKSMSFVTHDKHSESRDSFMVQITQSRTGDAMTGYCTCDPLWLTGLKATTN